MLNNNIVIFLFLAVNLAFSLKSTDFCIRKNKKCQGKFSYECGQQEICSNTIDSCNEYRHLYMKQLFILPLFTNRMLDSLILKERKRFIIFKNHIKICPNLNGYKLNLFI